MALSGSLNVVGGLPMSDTIIPISLSANPEYGGNMKFRGAPCRYLCSLALVLVGVGGILLSPSLGLSAATELNVFTLRTVSDYSWGASVATAELEVPFIHNQRGLVSMHALLAGSLLTLFGGVHWFALLRRKS